MGSIYFKEYDIEMLRSGSRSIKETMKWTFGNMGSISSRNMAWELGILFQSNL